MKFSTVLLATCLIAFTAAQWPCHDYGWNGAISNCASCTVGGNSGATAWSNGGWFSVCTNCTAGFFLNQSACIPCTANCTACYSNGACTQSGCAYGFGFVPTNNTCMACPSTLNCATCQYNVGSNSYGTFANGPFVCKSCQTSQFYISASTGACIACPTGCAGVALSQSTFASACSGGVCANCASGYYNSGSGTTTCTACAANCATCPAGTCGSCVSNAFYYGSNTCTACTVANCATCTSTAASTCDACAAGYYLSSNACTACPTGCAVCSSATACTSCTSGYYIAAAAPTTCVAVPTASLANCTTWANYASSTSTGGWCTACAANTTLTSSGTCVACPANCTTCVVPTSTATTSICLRCQLGYGLNDTTGNCVQCAPNCDYCDGSGVCTQCRKGAWPDSASAPSVAGLTWGASLTLPITQGFYLPPNQCQQCPYNCSSCANSTFCFNNCTKNYVFNATTNQCLPNGASRIVLAGFAFLGALFYFI